MPTAAESLAARIEDVADYFDCLENYFRKKSWKASTIIANLLSIHGPHSDYAFLHLTAFGAKRDRPYITDEVFDQIVVYHLQVLYYINVDDNLEQACTIHSQIVQIFIKEILAKRKEENWFLPIFYALCTDLRSISKVADESTERDEEREASSHYENSATFIMESYRTCITDVRADLSTSKKVAILNMTNQLFRIYFKINKLNLLKPLIRSIDNAGPLWSEFSMADKVTYKYFLGRKAMFDSDLPLAEKSLSYAFRNCPCECVRNKRLILVYLIPVKMFLGHMPSSHILHKYELDEFHDVVEAVKSGNLSQLDAALTTHESFFIQCGIFLMLEKLRTITFRNLFKRVAQIIGGSQIPLDAFLVVLRYLGVHDIDNEELACIIANLIAQNRIKGYISHQHQKLVISKTAAFPPLSSA